MGLFSRGRHWRNVDRASNRAAKRNRHPADTASDRALAERRAVQDFDIDTLVEAQFAQSARLGIGKSRPFDRGNDAMLLARQRFEADGTIGASVHDATDYQ
jgi:hypothetical protein